MTEKQPIYILPENIQRMIGKDAQRNNIMAARVVADTVKTTLGPKGMDKMLVSALGDIIITNDGVTILEEMEIEHPAAKMMVEIAKTQENEVGDGTTTAVMLAGKMLENAEKLLDSKVHPTVIAKGYRLASEKAVEILDRLAVRVTAEEEDILRNVAMTAMTGKGAEAEKEKFADIVVKAVKQVSEGNKIDLANIKIEKRKGGGIEETKLISGVVIDKERVHPDMPMLVENARIALIDSALEVKNPEIDTKVNISSPEQLQSFIEQEDKMLREMVEKIKRSSANVIFCQKGIDDIAQYYLTENKIYACRRVSKEDMEKLAKATKAKIISNLNELNSNCLGKAKKVEEIKEQDSMTYVTGCENPKALSIVVKGGTEHVTAEIERAIKDALGDVGAVIRDGVVVAGAGAIEIEIAKRLRDYGRGLSGREQLAIEEFANALEFIPTTLAENAGLDPINVLTELKSKHDAGRSNDGINIFNNQVEDCFLAGIIEPVKVKKQAISSASEVATMILRIDDVIASGNKPGRNMPAGADMGEY